jgi:hypothetical protein
VRAGVEPPSEELRIGCVDTNQWEVPMRKLLATVALTLAVVAVLPASAGAATAIEYGLIC